MSCNDIKAKQSSRVNAIRAQLRLENQCRAICRSSMGWRMDLPEKERNAINTRASKAVAAVFTGEPHEAVESGIEEFCLLAKPGIEAFIRYRKGVENEMRELAEKLPPWPWVEKVRGFGALGLAIVVGEAGDLSRYDNPGKLWSRLGLAPPDCYTMKCNDGTFAKAIPRRRRSAIWTLGDSLIKGNGDGEYRKAYDDRKAFEMAKPDMSKMHAHRRAQRYMEKRLMRDLWRAWKAATA